MKFENVEHYYQYMSQGNCFAPEFKNLTNECKAKWISDFNNTEEEMGSNHEAKGQP